MHGRDNRQILEASGRACEADDKFFEPFSRIFGEKK